MKNLSGIKTSFLFDVMNYAPLQQVAPKEKSELEKAKELAEEMERKRAELGTEGDTAGTVSQGMTPNGKKKKRVGFADKSMTGSLGMMGEKTIMRTRPILSDEHEQT